MSENKQYEYEPRIFCGAARIGKSQTTGNEYIQIRLTSSDILRLVGSFLNGLVYPSVTIFFNKKKNVAEDDKFPYYGQLNDYLGTKSFKEKKSQDEEYSSGGNYSNSNDSENKAESNVEEKNVNQTAEELLSDL